MTSTLHVSSRPAQWTLDQPSSPQGEATANSSEFKGFTCTYQPEYKPSDFEPVFEFKPICEYKASDIKLPEVEVKATESNSTGFNASGFSTGFTSTGFQQISESVEQSALTTAEDYTSPDDGMARSIVKIEARFENKLTGHSIWKIGNGLLFSPDIVVAGSEVVYDAEYQLGAATQVKCYIGYRGRNSSEIQPRYGQRVVFSAEWTEGYDRHSRDIAFIKVAKPFARVAASHHTVEEPAAPAVTHCSNCSGHQELAPEPIPEPALEPVAQHEPEPEPEVEVEVEITIPETNIPEPEVCYKPGTKPVVLETELQIPVPAQSDGYIEVEPIDAQDDDTPATSVAEDITDPFYETLKTVSQIDTKTLNIESSLIDDVGQFVSVAAGSLVSYVIGAETISSGTATELPGVPERALLAEASLQAILAIEQSDELDEIIASMKENWTASAPEADQLSELLAPYLSDAAQYIVEYHQQDDIAQVATKQLKRRNLGIRQFPNNENTKAFIKGIFEPTLPLAGRENVFSSLGPVLQSAISTVEQIVCQAGKPTVDTLVPRLLAKHTGTTSSASDVQATRVLVQRAIMADAAYQALSTLSKEKLQVLKVIPLDGDGPQDETLFDFIKRVMQRDGPVCLHDAKQAVDKFIPLLLDPSQTPDPVAPTATKVVGDKFTLRDFLSSKKGSVKNL